VQTHPSLSSGVPRPIGKNTLRTSGPAKPSKLSSNVGVNGFVPGSKQPFRHFDYTVSATHELRRNPNLSAPDECARACREGEPPRTCYYHFTLEYYTVLGA